MSVSSRIECDRCKESHELKADLSATYLQARFPEGYQTVTKRFPLTDKSGQYTFKSFTVCGKCIADHRKQNDALFDTYYADLQ